MSKEIERPLEELRQIFDSNKGADGTLVISKRLAERILSTPAVVALPPKVPVVIPNSREEAEADYMIGAAYNLAIDNCRKQIESAGLACVELRR